MFINKDLSSQLLCFMEILSILANIYPLQTELSIEILLFNGLVLVFISGNLNSQLKYAAMS
ncbi:hypothetical protein FACS189496_4710 [Bacilli bacterium]|nr:hypothetical protein FACS189496_4710 [Bacilli bacterium]